MNTSNCFIHILETGDNLYQLARYYNTSVPLILSLNPGIDPYNLPVGNKIIIKPNQSSYAASYNSHNSLNRFTQLDLIKNMRLLWSQHVYWTRMALISIAEKLKDQNAVINQLLKNPDNIANLYRDFYSEAVSAKITQLLTEHLQIGAELITALRDGRNTDAEKLNKQWYLNADKMAETFSSINPYYKYEELRNMLYEHLQLTTQEVSMRLAGNYAADIEMFNKVEAEAMMMADYFSSGIVQQFPQKFF